MGSTPETITAPPMVVHLGPHGTEHDLQSAQPDIERANILIPELPLVPDNIQRKLAGIASGNAYALDDMLRMRRDTAFGGYDSALFRTIYGQNKAQSGETFRLGVTDIPATPYWTKQYRRLGSLMIPNIGDTVNETLDRRYRNTVEYTGIQQARDEVTVRNTSDYLARVAGEGVGEEHLAVTLRGREHTSIVERFKDAGVDASLSEYSSLEPRTHEEELIDTIWQGNQPTRSLLLRSLLTQALTVPHGYVGGSLVKSHDSSVALHARRSLVDVLDDDQVETLVQNMIDVKLLGVSRSDAVPRIRWAGRQIVRYVLGVEEVDHDASVAFLAQSGGRERT